MRAASSPKRKTLDEIEQLRARVAELERERQSEQTYSTLFDKAPYAIALTRMPEASITGVNDAFLELFGYAREEVLGKSGVDLGISDVHSQAQVAEEFNARGVVRDFECVRTTKSGARRIVSLTLDWVSIGSQKHVLTMIRDITESKQAQQALRDSEERLRVTLDGTGVGTFEYRPDTGDAIWDARAKAIWGLDPDAEVTYPQMMERIHPEDRSQVRAAMEAALQAGSDESYQSEYRAIWPDGSVHWISGRSRILFAGVGDERRAVRIIGIHQDVTERKRAEERLRTGEEQLRRRAEEVETLMEVAPVAIWVSQDPQCDGIAGNRTANSFYEAHEKENVSANVSSARRFFQGGRELKPEELPMQEAVVRNIEIRNSELEVLLPSGKWMHMLGSAIPLHDEQGRVRGCVGGFVDITDRKRAEQALRESEAVLRGFYDSPGMIRGIVELIDGTIVHVSCNAAAARLYGIDREAIAGKTAIQAGASADVVRAWVGVYEQSRRTGEPVSLEYARRDADGRDRWLLATASFLGTGRSGHPRFAYTVLDLTERKRAEERLRDSETKYRRLFESIQEMVTVYEVERDGNGRIIERRLLDANPAFVRAAGVPSIDQIRRKTSSEVFGSNWSESHAAAIQEAMDSGETRMQEIYHPESGRHYITTIVPLNANTYLGTGRDITERKKAEERLRESEKLYRAIGESLDYGVWVCDPDGRNTYASESFLKLVGLTQEQCSNFGWGDVLHPDDAAKTIEAWKECVRTERNWDIEHRYRGVDGKWHPILARGLPVRDDQGRITCWVGINLDIAAMERAQEELRQSEERYRTMFDTMLEGFCIIEVIFDASGRPVDYRFVEINPAFETQTGLKNARGRLIRELIPDNEAHWFELYGQVALTGQPAHLVNEVKGLGRWYEVSAYRVGGPGSRKVAVLFNDITESRQAEERLRQAQKLESLGLLAGGVAHDFNNLLVGVIGNASLAKEFLPPDNPAAELLESVVRTGEQAAHLTRQMLAYSGKGRFVVEPLDLTAIIPDMSGLVRPSISKKIRLDLNLQEDLPPIEADRGQVQQIFMNLAINASEAVGSHEGLISVRTGVQNVDDRYQQLHPEAAGLGPGEYVFLEVRDTGCGIDDATRAKIFDPFFSTKFTGRGLGLAAVAGIVRGHQGAITVTSAPGKGSCFTVLFPVAARAAGTSIATARNDALDGAGTVLVVDDEPVVLEMAKRALERHGYEVLVAESGMAALDVFRRYAGEIALVVLDLSMPGMNGEDALPELRKIRPGTKVVVSSGYTEAETMTLFQGQKISGFLQKPYTVSGIADKVKRALA